MSEQSALGVGTAISAAMVTDVESGFHEEHFELMPSEVGAMREQFAGLGDAELEEDV